MTQFQKVSNLFQSVEEAVRVANTLDKAYADATDPSFHKPFTLEGNPQMVAMNLAGLYAADTAANLLGVDDSGQVTETAYLEALQRIAAKQLSPKERYTVKNAANLSWRSGQPFRDLSTKPLNRITRSVNSQFNTLPPDEQDKDLVQTVIGAQLILSWLSSN